MHSRRHFIALSASTFASTLLPASLLSQQNRYGGAVFSNASVGAYQQGLLTRARFQSLVGSDFRLYLDNYITATLTLREVSVTDATPKTPRKAGRDGKPIVIAPAGADTSVGRSQVQPETFVLRFNVTGPGFLQDSYLVDHAILGKFPLFLSSNLQGRCSAIFTSFADKAFLEGQIEATQRRAAIR